MEPSIFLVVLFALTANAQFSAMDRTQQELNLMDWSAGFRMAYCQHANIHELIEPFKDAMVRMTNRFLQERHRLPAGATASFHLPTTADFNRPFRVTFTKYHVVLLDGFPKRMERSVSFRFFIALPHDAKPLNKKMEKPFLPIAILTEILRTQSAELTNRLGWQLISRDRYPRFDQVTTFMNRALIPIGIGAGLFMLFLAYWQSTIISGSSIYSSEGWMVSGSTGGKNAALRRTMEIIAEQEYRFHHMEKHRKSGEEIFVYTAVPRDGQIPPNQQKKIELTAAQLPRTHPNVSKQSSSAAEDEEDYGSEAHDTVPEIVIMHARDSSRDTMDSDGRGGRRTSGAGHRRQSRRFSAFDTLKNKSRGGFFSGGRGSQPERHKKWRTGMNIMLNQFSKDGKL
ncbi:hypothetical protein M3Y99_00440800 [Aphelenchoides fujianensis]|nr:hypothetical protein M3Y99_00440800 [Aphelenchoides fujianensis]